jgi:DNA (cytosine-5)-methyltransferase 1
LSEIEPFPSAVLAHHYPDVPNLGDMTTLPERILSGEVEAPDVFCGGTPCQAFSVAGLRNSLDDARGNLSLTFVGIANAIDHVRSVRSDAPAIVFWENVPGVLSTKDNAFGCFLGALAGEDDPIIPSGEKWTNAGCVYGPQRTVAWRVLDAQYFGVAQRRRRVFVVASARNDFDPASVLFEFDGLRRDIAPSREKGQAIAPCVTNGPPFSRTGNERVKAEAMVVQPYEVGNCLTARMHKGINSTLDEGQTPVIALQDVTPREKAQNGRGWNDDGTAYTVDTHATQGVAQPIVAMRESGLGYWMEDTVAGTLDANMGMSGHANRPAVMTVPQAMAVRRLTPVECERLQGFPDNYTNIPWRKKDESPDGPRYKALGNSWAVPVVAWIGKRIEESLK